MAKILRKFFCERARGAGLSVSTRLEFTLASLRDSAYNPGVVPTPEDIELQNIAVYVRVSSRSQDTRSQEADLHRWIDAFANGQPVKWYRDTASGTTMERSAWKRLEADYMSGRVSRLVVWRLDRLGRTAAGLTALFEDLQRRNIGFESVRDSIDLSTAAGRLMGHVLASVAVYENEVRGERIRAGQAAARAQGKRWGGSEKGRRLKVNEEQIATVHRMAHEGCTKSAMARATGLSRPTIYSILNANERLATE